MPAEHLAVLQHPGPDGQRPSALAARSGMSRQAINHLISHLEQAGYAERYTDPAGARLVRLTGRGRVLYHRIEATAVAVEAEWAEQIGASRTCGPRSPTCWPPGKPPAGTTAAVIPGYTQECEDRDLSP